MSKQLSKSRELFAKHGLDNNNSYGIEFRDMEDGSKLYGIAESLRDAYGKGVVIGAFIFFGSPEEQDKAITFLQENESKIDGYYGYDSVDFCAFPTWSDFDKGKSCYYTFFCA